MRITMVNAYAFVTGGADSQCLELSEELEARGHEVAFLATQSERNLVDRGRFIRSHVSNQTRDGLPLFDRARVAARAIWNREAAEQVRTLLRSARVALVSSLWQEPAGLSALEAMSCGTPVVAYSSGGLVEYVGKPHAGSVVRPEARELARASRELVQDRRLWQGCSARGIAAVSERHDLGTYADRLEDLYAGAASENRQ